MIRRMTRGSAPNRAREASQRPGSFEKGHVKIGGRKQGTPNVMTKELKLAVIEAAHRLGSDLKGKDGVIGYLTRLAKNDIKTFVMLLNAVLPVQIKKEARNRRYYYNEEPVRYPTVAEIREEMRARGFPMLLMKLEPVVNLMNSGKSASEAMRAAGLNARLERVQSAIDPPEEFPSIRKNDDDEQFGNTSGRDKSHTA